MVGPLDDDTVRTVQSGRETMGAMLSTAQTHLQKVFIVFVVGMLGSIYALQYGVWEMLREDLVYANMSPELRQQTSVVSTQAFDVILLQVKIGAVVGILLGIPVLIFYSRDALRARGWWPADRIPVWKGALFVLTSLVLFAGGVFYAYELFFPLMFKFLAGNANAAGFTPQYSIVKWAQFIFLLGASFGLAAQLPLLMTVLSYTGIVPYETFRDKWRVAVLLIFLFGALFSPPDPFTQIMWAAPLCGLYGISLALSKVAVLGRRSSDLVSTSAVAREHWNTVLGGAVVVGGLTYYLLATPAFQYVRAFAAWFPSSRLTGDVARPALLGLAPETTAILLAAVFGLLAVPVVLYYHVLQVLSDAAAPDDREMGDPTAIDVDELNADAVEVAPPEVFEAMTEEEALAHADTALSADDEAKAQAILDRWDAVHEASDDPAGDAAGDAQATDEEEGVVTSTTAGMVDAFTEEETTEEEIGGYYYDIQFILSSLASKAFWILGVFGLVLSGAFLFLYRGGIGEIQRVFVSRLPQEMQSQVDIVTLHPVEHLIFIVKFSTLLGAVSVIPLVLYFAWPSMQERELVGGDRNLLLVWGGTLFVTLIGGSLVGFLYVAPITISAIAYDQLQANMVIAYRISNFGWLILFLTIGIGLLVEIPVTMFLFHRGGLVSFETMLERWRYVVLAIVATAAMVTPDSIFTMLIVGVPTALSYMVGLGILWVYTLGGRRTPKGRGEPAD